MTRLVATMLLLAFTGMAGAAGPPDAATWERFGKIEEAGRVEQRADALYQAGKWPETTALLAQVLRMREELYPKTRYPQGHPELAVSINNLAFLHKAQGEYAKAEPLYRRALEMFERLYPKARYPQGHPQLAISISNLASLHHAHSEYAKAEPLYRRTLEMFERLYPKASYPQGHPYLAISINNLSSSKLGPEHNQVVRL